MKDRLDIILYKKGIFESREKAQAAIMAGIVSVNGHLEDKAGKKFDENSAIITIKENPNKYVSRGGLKLEAAIIHWNIDLTDKICMDIGASTGGFTDLMLKSNAKTVYAVDVGYGQLDYKLRENPKVINMERTNIRYVESDGTGTKLGKDILPLDFISIDVSFISLKLVLPVAHKLMNGGGYAVALIKPQFEAGREQVGKGGIVRDEKVRAEVIDNVINFSEKLGFSVYGVIDSPIKGAKGNVEYLIYLGK